jgi:copper transport protein
VAFAAIERVNGRYRTALVVAVVSFVALAAGDPSAHSGLRFSSPLEGTALGASPTHVQLAFIERPEPSLATIRVSDTSGQTYHIGQPETVSGDPLTLQIAVRTLPRGVYVVNWRVVSAVDGHATAGAFAFGVQMAPTGPPPAADAPTTSPLLEIIGRSVFLLGLIVALGAATYKLMRLGDAPWVRFAGAGALAAGAGLAILIVAQWRAGDAELRALIGTSIGRAWMARTAGIAVALVGVAVSTLRTNEAVRQLGAIVIWLAACGAIAVHGFAGHAAAGRLPVASTVIVHAIHVAAAGMWIGGLVIVIAGLKSSADGARVRALARFSMLAAIGLAVVAITGVARSIHEVGTWGELATTTYGALVITKVMLLLAIAALGALNRWRHLPAAINNTQPLRRTSRAEIALAAAAIVVASGLATLPPPAAATALPGIEVSGADFATTVKATLTAVSDQPGPNRFTVAVEDYDSGESISPNRVSLRFTPVDDPGVPPTLLALAKDEDGMFTGTGANVVFDGRWRVNVLMEHGVRSVEVPLEFEARGLPQHLSTVRVPGRPTVYRVEVGTLVVHFTVDREQQGDRQLQISCFNAVTEPCGIREVVVTARNDAVPTRQLPVTPLDRNRFTAPIYLERGMNHIAVVARIEGDHRLRATLALKITNGG